MKETKSSGKRSRGRNNMSGGKYDNVWRTEREE